MSKFWQKKYISKYTGAEIDAAVAKAGTVPAVTEADAGKALVVNEEGEIVAGSNVPLVNLTDDELQVFLGAIIPKLVTLTDKITRAVVDLSAETTHVPEIYEKLETTFATLGSQGFIPVGPNAVILAYCREFTGSMNHIVTEWVPLENQTYSIKCMFAIQVKLLTTGSIQLDVIAQKMNEASS